MNHTNGSYCMAGESQHIKDVRAWIGKVAPYDVNVLIVGETGTGKELVARGVYSQSPRRAGRFLAVNCSAVPKELAENEFFGHDRGAFTGANMNGREGYFETADGGILFLDEISTMPVEIQPKLLRAVEYQKFMRVGSSMETSTDVRIISATNDMNIFHAANFRRDLLYRLGVEMIQLKPLKERPEDIEPIARYFLESWISEQKKELPKEAVDVLKAYDFPGNVREMQTLLQRAYIASPDGQIDPAVLQQKIDEQKRIQAREPKDRLTFNSDGYTATYKWEAGDYKKFAAIDVMVAAIRFTNGNLKQAASLLGISRTNLHRRMHYYGVWKELEKYGLRPKQLKVEDPERKIYPHDLCEATSMFVEDRITRALTLHDGDIASAAKYLRISSRKLRSEIAKLEIDVDKKK